MTLETNNQSRGHLPLPQNDLTLEQEFFLKHISLELHKADKENIIELFTQLQEHAYILQNNIQHILNHWPEP